MKHRMWNRMAAAVLVTSAGFYGGMGCSSSGVEEPAAGEAANAITTCITIQRGTHGNVKDALLSSVGGKEHKNYGASGSLTASTDPTGVREALVRWDLSEIPFAATINSATATFTRLLDGGAPLSMHNVAVTWSEASVNYNDFGQAFDPAVVATLPDAAQPSTDVASLVQSWVSGAVPNNGVLINRTATGTTVLASSEVSDVTQRPKLDVCFTPSACPCATHGTWAEGLQSPFFMGCSSSVVAVSTSNGESQFYIAADVAQQKCIAADLLLYYSPISLSVTPAELAACQASIAAATGCTYVDPCAPNPCQNGGTCSGDGASGHLCECPAGFYGANCELADCPCASNGTWINALEAPVSNCATSVVSVNTFNGESHFYVAADVAQQTCIAADNDFYYTPISMSVTPAQLAGCQASIAAATGCTYVDPCSPNPCPSGTTCVGDGGSSYLCQ